MYSRAGALRKLESLQEPVLNHCMLLIFGQPTDPLKKWRLDMKGFLIWAYAACYTKPRMSRKTLRNKLFPVWEVESLEACIYRCHDVYGIYEYDVPANISDGLHAWQNSVIEFLMKKEYDNELCDNLIENLQQFSHE